MNERVAFLTMESDEDLIVSFVLLRGGLEDVRSLILMRTPKYEFMLDPSERRVHVSHEDYWDEEDWLRSIRFAGDRVEIETDLRQYELDIRGVDPDEIREAHRVLKLMNFDDSFRLLID